MSWNDPMQVTGVPAPHAQAYPATPPGYAEHATIPVSPTGLETAAAVTAKTATAMKALIVAGCLTGFVVLCGAGVIGYQQFKAHNAYNEKLALISQECSNRPDADQAFVLLEQSWFTNPLNPLSEAVKQSSQHLEYYCLNSTFEVQPGWMTNDKLDKLDKALFRITEEKENLETSIDEAYAYADFSYAVLQTSLAKGQGTLHLRGTLDPQGASRALEKVTNALEDLNSFLNTPDVDVAALKERTSLLRQTVAEYKEYLGSSDNAKYFQDALAALEPLLPTKNSAESKGLIPVFFPSASPLITYTDDELTFHRPERVGDFLLVDTDLGEYGHPRFHYSDGTRTARFEEIDFPSEAFPEDFRYDAERFLTYTGRYDEVWSHKPGTEYVMVVRSADGRFWQASVSGNADGATYRGIGYTWLKAFN